MTVTIGSLCSGYGGLEQGLALALGGDARTAWHVEYDKHPSLILAHRYPGVPNYGDVKTTDWTQVEPVDWLTAGYPCQPFSLAGLRKGEDDPRHLWPDVARAVGVLRPRHVLLENVAAHLRVGFDTVLADFARLGYDASWGVVRASDAGAPHGRARVFIVASDTDDGGPRHGRTGSHGRPVLVDGVGAIGVATDDTCHGRREGWPEPAGVVGRPDAAERGVPVAADTDRSGLEVGRRLVGVGCDADGRDRSDGHGQATELATQWGAYAPAIRRWEHVTGRPAPRPTEPARRGERLSPRFVEWMMGLPAGWVTDVPGLPRNAQLKALGNGVVPQQAALACRLLGVTREAGAA